MVFRQAVFITRETRRTITFRDFDKAFNKKSDSLARYLRNIDLKFLYTPKRFYFILAINYKSNIDWLNLTLN